MIEQTNFAYRPLGKAFEKQVETTEDHRPLLFPKKDKGW